MTTEVLEIVMTQQGTVRIRVQARPRSRASRASRKGNGAVYGLRDGALVVPLAAAPVDGAANAELVETLADTLGVPKRDVVIVRGDASRAKTIEIRGLSFDEIRSRLAAAIRVTD